MGKKTDKGEQHKSRNAQGTLPDISASISPDATPDMALWQQAVSDVTPLCAQKTTIAEQAARDIRGRYKSKIITQQPDNELFGVVVPAQALLPESLTGKATRDTPIRTPNGLDARTRERLEKGLIPIEARLDLHGMTQAKAHGALTHFITQCAAQKMRCLLVITGKGDHTAGTPEDWWESPRGVLRSRLQDWLAEPALRPLVVHTCKAHSRHGGSGAWYVYLGRLG